MLCLSSITSQGRRLPFIGLTHNVRMRPALFRVFRTIICRMKSDCSKAKDDWKWEGSRAIHKWGRKTHVKRNHFTMSTAEASAISDLPWIFPCSFKNALALPSMMACSGAFLSMGLDWYFWPSFGIFRVQQRGFWPVHMADANQKKFFHVVSISVDIVILV